MQPQVLLTHCLNKGPTIPAGVPGYSQKARRGTKTSFYSRGSPGRVLEQEKKKKKKKTWFPSPSLHVVMAGLHFSTLSFSLSLSASTTLLTPLPMPKINFILYYKKKEEKGHGCQGSDMSVPC
jgi:hypothetical protein